MATNIFLIFHLDVCFFVYTLYWSALFFFNHFLIFIICIVTLYFITYFFYCFGSLKSLSFFHHGWLICLRLYMCIAVNRIYFFILFYSHVCTFTYFCDAFGPIHLSTFIQHIWNDFVLSWCDF